ncbi:ribosome maturation factor RimP [Luteimonas sp. e5]
MDKAGHIAGLLAPTVESLGLELLGVEYMTAPGGAVLRLYIDYPESAEPRAGEDGQTVAPSVGIDECEQVSREVSAQLDVEDPISGQYTLEVSSPGLDRPLFSAAQFSRFIGETVKAVLKLPQDGRRRLTGRIVAVEGEEITFDIDGQPFVAAMDNIDKARLVPDWAALGYARDKPGRKPGVRGGNKKSSHKQAESSADAEPEQ